MSPVRAFVLLLAACGGGPTPEPCKDPSRADGALVDRRVVERLRGDACESSARLAVGDLDGDSDLDLAYSRGAVDWTEEPEQSVRLFLDLETDDPPVSEPHASLLGALSSVALTDANADGLDDLVRLAPSPTFGLSWTEVWLSPVVPGDLSPTAPDARIEVPGRARISVVLADLEGDGTAELVLGQGDYDSVYLYDLPLPALSNANDARAVADHYGGGAFGAVLNVGDANLDGLDDVASAASHDDPAVWPGRLGALYFLGLGLDGEVDFSRDLVARVSSPDEWGAVDDYQWSLGDFDGDGAVDAQLYLSDDQLSVVAGPFEGDVEGIDHEVARWDLSRSPSSVGAGDLDADGLDDVVMFEPDSYGHPHVWLIWGPIRGTGILGIDLSPGDQALRPANTTLVTLPDDAKWIGTDIAVEDWDGDGAAEVLFPYCTGADASPQLLVLRGDPVCDVASGG